MRAFIASFLPERVLRELSEVERAWGSDLEDARWTKSSDRHLTLAFLGSIEDDRCADAAEILRALSSQPPIEARLGSATGFPHPGRARVAVVEVISGRLNELAENIRSELRADGFSIEDRAFRAHVTLARFRRPASLEPTPPVDPVEWPIDSVALVESRLQDPLNRYVVKAEVGFG